MNHTNRGLNRAILLLIGLVLLLAGAAVVLAASWQTATDLWSLAVRRSEEGVRAASDSLGTGLSYLALAVLALLVVLLLVAIVRVGGGRSRAVLQADASGSAGRIVVKDAFASDALQHSLAARSDVVSARVTTSEVRDATVMHVAITARPTASPRRIADEVGVLTDNLATLLGKEIPTYVSIRSGLRARMAPESRGLN